MLFSQIIPSSPSPTESKRLFYTSVCLFCLAYRVNIICFLICCLEFVIAFLPRIKHLFFSWLQSPFTVILEPKKIKSVTTSTFSSFAMKWWDAVIFVFWVLSFKTTSSLSSFTLIKKLLSSISCSALWVMSSACLRLLIFLPAVLIPACASSSLVFHMIHSV